jgi:hypothetical protein
MLLSKNFQNYKNVVFNDAMGKAILLSNIKSENIMGNKKNKNKIIGYPYGKHESNYLPTHV